MKGSTSCRVCRHWFEGDWSAADAAGRKEIERQMHQGHCDECTPPAPYVVRPPRTRAELLQLQMVHGAAAAAAEAELKDRARQLFAEEGSADTWRLPGGQVIVQLTNDRAEIADRDAFLAWLAAAYPHQVTTRTIVVTEVINEKWLTEELLASLTPLDPDEADPGEATMLMDAEGTIVPGVTWRKGGGLYGVSVRPDATVKRRLKEAAAAYIDGTGTLPGIETGETRGATDA